MNAHETTEIRELNVGEIEIVAGGGEYGPFSNEEPKKNGPSLSDVVSAVVETVVGVVRALPIPL
jgi:hypothetical protein